MSYSKIKKVYILTSFYFLQLETKRSWQSEHQHSSRAWIRSSSVCVVVRWASQLLPLHVSACGRCAPDSLWHSHFALPMVTTDHTVQTHSICIGQTLQAASSAVAPTRAVKRQYWCFSCWKSNFLEAVICFINDCKRFVPNHLPLLKKEYTLNASCDSMKTKNRIANCQSNSRECLVNKLIIA